MFYCPNCGMNTVVRDTRVYGPKDEEYTRRRRICLSKRCGIRFSTQEHLIVESISHGPSSKSNHLPKYILMPLEKERVKTEKS